MKRLFILALGICLLLCSGCSSTPKAAETLPPSPGETVPATEPEATVHAHTFGPWEYAEAQMQRLCEVCGEAELRDMTDEERFRHLLTGHWEPYEVTFMGETQLVYYIRTGVWQYYVDYAAGDTLTHTAAFGNADPADFKHPLSFSYSHYDPESKTHHATAVSEDGRSYQVALETDHPEPLLHLTPEAGTDLFDRIVFSRYAQVAPVAAGTWSGIAEGKVLYITLDQDQTFTSNIDTFPSGTWQLAPGDSSELGGLQLFFESAGKQVSALCVFLTDVSDPPDVEAAQLGIMLEIITPSKSWSLWKLQPEQLQPLLATGENAIIGTWNSKSTRSYIGDDTTSHIQTGYTLTVNSDGTFTMLADKQISGTWIFNESGTSGSNVYYYLFTYPGSSKKGEQITFYPQSGELSFCYKLDKPVYVSFAQYSQEQWDDFLAGPSLLPGDYVSTKLVRYDKQTSQATEETQTGYTLTIKEDGTVTGTLHKPVSGTWFYDNVLSEEGGHRYIFRMDHTPPEQSSVREDDGTLVFDTKIDGEHVVIYFDPQ